MSSCMNCGYVLQDECPECSTLHPSILAHQQESASVGLTGYEGELFRKAREAEQRVCPSCQSEGVVVESDWRDVENGVWEEYIHLRFEDERGEKQWRWLTSIPEDTP